MFKIFYSWQSDLNHNKTRYFIQECIDKAIDLAQKAERIEASRDEATKDVTGSPNIVQTLFSKIDTCDLFIADVSLCYENSSKQKKSPNPNVLIELGYAVHALGWERIICLFNSAYGKIEELPFDIQQNRITCFSLEGGSRTEVRSEIVEIIFKTLRDLRDSEPRVKDGMSQFVVGTYDERHNKVIAKLNPISINERNDIRKIEQYKEQANQLVIRIKDFSQRIKADRAFEEQTMHMIEENEEENALLKALNVSGYAELRKSLQDLQNLGSASSFYDKYTKPVEAFEKDAVIGWLTRYLSFTPEDDFFDFGNLSKTRFELGFKKEEQLNGSENETKKYECYKELYKALFHIFIRTEFVKTFTGLLFFPIAIQNISKMNDDNIRIVIEIERGKAVAPTKRLILNDLYDQRGWICHFGLVDELFHLPKNPMVEIQTSTEQTRNPSYHFTLNGYEKDKEDENDYEANLQQYILKPIDSAHYSASIYNLRPRESMWLSGGLLLEPDNGSVVLRYSIHSTNSAKEINGRIEYSE